MPIDAPCHDKLDVDQRVADIVIQNLKNSLSHCKNRSVRHFSHKSLKKSSFWANETVLETLDWDIAKMIIISLHSSNVMASKTLKTSLWSFS